MVKYDVGKFGNGLFDAWSRIFKFFETKLSLSSFKQGKVPNFRIKKCYQIPVEIRQIDLKPDRNRNPILKPEIRPEPDSAGFPVGFY